jgi:hypothetical protein
VVPGFVCLVCQEGEGLFAGVGEPLAAFPHPLICSAFLFLCTPTS